MAEEKLKSENYANFGGINSKASPYVTGPMEFLDLRNVDGRIPGTFSTFAGSTLFSTEGSTSPVTGMVDFTFGFSGSATFSLATQSFSILATDQNHLCNVTGTTFLSVYDFIYPNASGPFSLVQAENVYGCNGFDAFTYQGFTAAWQYGLPKPMWGYTNTLFSHSGSGGFSGTAVVYYAFVRRDGLVGPAIGLTYQWAGYTVGRLTPPTINLTPGAGVSVGSFGISGLRVWIAENGGPAIDQYTLVGVSGILNGLTLISGAGHLTVDNAGNALTPPPDDYQGAFLYGLGATQGSAGGWDPVGVTTTPIPSFANFVSNPSIFETWNNSLWSAGFGPNPHRVVGSRPGEFEKHDYDDFFDVNEKGKDRVSCLKGYFTQLVIFEVGTTWSLSGTSFDNYVLAEVSPIYGCLSSRGACVWKQNLWFLDKQGICEFNGANTQIVSNKVQPYFDRMNVAAARTEAIMLHVKDRNEVWCAIPIDGASRNNLIVVYDYLSDAWYTRDTPNELSAFALISLGNNKQVVYSGSASGTIHSWGSSLSRDNGVAFTCLIKSRFIGDLGFSVEKMFRRLFLDATVPVGTTQVFAINFYADQGSSPYLQTTMSLSSFQNRIDFGVPAKAMAVEIIYPGGEFFRLNGFTIESRFQRAV